VGAEGPEARTVLRRRGRSSFARASRHPAQPPHPTSAAAALASAGRLGTPPAATCTPASVSGRAALRWRTGNTPPRSGNHWSPCTDGADTGSRRRAARSRQPEPPQSLRSRTAAAPRLCPRRCRCRGQTGGERRARPAPATAQPDGGVSKTPKDWPVAGWSRISPDLLARPSHPSSAAARNAHCPISAALRCVFRVWSLVSDVCRSERKPTSGPSPDNNARFFRFPLFLSRGLGRFSFLFSFSLLLPRRG